MDALYAAIGRLAEHGWLPGAFGYPFMVRGLFAVLLLAPILGGLSHLVVARRMAFFSAAIGQASLTGVSVGLLLGEPLNSPYAGLFGVCLLSATWMVFVKRRSSIPNDTLIGVFLALTLGLGVCLLVAVTRRFNVHQVESVMFGSLLTVTDRDLTLLLLVGAAVAFLLGRRYNELLLDGFHPGIAKAHGTDSALLDYLIALLLCAAIVVSLKIIGALLVEALIVVPAAASRNVARGMRSYFFGSIAIALFAGIGGLAISYAWLIPTGGAVVLVLAGIFFVTLGAGRARA